MMSPHTFRPGVLSTADAEALNRLTRAGRGLTDIQVRPPLSIVRGAFDSQPVIFFDQNPGFFFAEILGSAAAYPSGGSGTDADDRAYSWVERVQDVAGVWKDGTRFGEFNAYAAESETGFPGEVAAGTMVMMRASSSAAGTWEFLPAASGSGGGGGGSTLTSGLTYSSGFTLNAASGTFQTVISTPTMAPGTYLVSYSVAALYNTNTAGDYLEAYTRNGANTQAYMSLPFCTIQAANVNVYDVAAGSFVGTLTASDTFVLQVRRVFSGTVTTSQIPGLGFGWRGSIVALKIG